MKLLDRPVVPGAAGIDAIDPDVGIDQNTGAAAVAGETRRGHGVRGAGFSRRRARSP